MGARFDVIQSLRPRQEKVVTVDVVQVVIVFIVIVVVGVDGGDSSGDHDFII